jgi:hypothetical protein
MPSDKQPSSQGASHQPASEAGGRSNSAAQSTAGKPPPPVASSLDDVSALPEVPFSIDGHLYLPGIEVSGGGSAFFGNTYGDDGDMWNVQDWKDQSRRVINNRQGIPGIYLADEPQVDSGTGSAPSPKPGFAPRHGTETNDSEQASAGGSAPGPDDW